MPRTFYLTRFTAAELKSLRTYATRCVAQSSPRLSNWLLDEIGIEQRRRKRNLIAKRIPREAAPVRLPIYRWKARDLAGALRAVVIALMLKNEKFAPLMEVAAGLVVSEVEHRLRTSELRPPGPKK